MILKNDEIIIRIDETDLKRKIVLCPLFREEIEKSNSSSIDLRLGTRFLSTKHSRSTILDIEKEDEDINMQRRLMDYHYVPFGKPFILQPKDFVLGVTLEWIKLPVTVSGYVQGKSSWGRRGLVIATAVGVHCGFSGCLTLELSNLGEVPIAIYPGMKICQLFLHEVSSSNNESESSRFFGKSRPLLGRISMKDDKIACSLSGFNLDD